MKKRIWLISVAVLVLAASISCAGKGETKDAFTHELQWQVKEPVTVEAYEPAVNDIYPGQAIRWWYRVTNHSDAPQEMIYEVEYSKEKFEELLPPFEGTATYQEGNNPPVPLVAELYFPGEINLDVDGYGPKIAQSYLGNKVQLRGNSQHFLYFTLVVPDNWDPADEISIKVIFRKYTGGELG